MVKSTLELLEAFNHIVKNSLETRKDLLKNPAFNDTPLSKGIEDYTNISEKLEKLISEEYAKVQK